jgi:hypothetical protein
MCTVPAVTTNPDGSITITRPNLIMPGDIEQGWRWCMQCQGLYLASDTRGICPVRPQSRTGGIPAMVIGPHKDSGSGQYRLFHAHAGGCVQTGWTRCGRCHGLYFGQAGRTGCCRLAAAATSRPGPTTRSTPATHRAAKTAGDGAKNVRGCSIPSTAPAPARRAVPMMQATAVPTSSKPHVEAPAGLAFSKRPTVDTRTSTGVGHAR